jgi:hypothetical protein
MTKEEKELCIMSLVAEGNDEKTKRGKKRQRSRKTFRVTGKTVCKGTFMLCYDITKYALGAIVKHVSQHGVTPRQHGNAGKKPKHAITYYDVMRVVHFIRNYAEERGLPQPAAPRCLDNIPPVYLTSDTTKNRHASAVQTVLFRSPCARFRANVIQRHLADMFTAYTYS